MGIPKSYPMRCTFKGLSDAFDSTDKFPGACRAITDLIFDQSNPEILISRPGVVTLEDLSLAGFFSPAFISIQVTVGNYIFGMVATTRNAGNDEPFVYDITTSSFVTISGVTAGNTPTSPASTGAWTPPTLTQVGVYVIITHPGFTGAGGDYFGVINMTTPATPAWSATNLATTPLTAVPTAVANFNNRAYFAVANALPFGDPLTLTRTNADQQLTIGDGSIVTALSGLPIQTTSAGVIGSLTVFKGNQVWQVTGDPTNSNLALNFLSLNVGTLAPRSVVLSPLGLYFADVSGPYYINFLGAVVPVCNKMQETDPDIQMPFVNTTEPSRMAAAYAAQIYRICIPTVINGASVTNDYWFHEFRRRWTGPHSFAYDCASGIGNYFVLSSAANPGLLIQSQAQQSLSSVYTDLGNTLTGIVQSATFPKTHELTQKQVVESTQELSTSGGNAAYSITAQDEQGNTLGSVSITVSFSGALWGFFLWGGALWGNSRNIPHVYSLPWAAPLVFQKMAILISAVASANLQIGTFYARYQDTGYMNLTAPNTP